MLPQIRSPSLPVRLNRLGLGQAQRQQPPGGIVDEYKDGTLLEPGLGTAVDRHERTHAGPAGSSWMQARTAALPGGTHSPAVVIRVRKVRICL